MSKRFQRKQENFQCENCGYFVQGNGYTNHCPQCLWSKHVDLNPGDRQSTCHGMMEPIKVDQKKGAYMIVHKCLTCGLEKRNKTDKDDNFEVLLFLSAY